MPKEDEDKPRVDDIPVAPSDDSAPDDESNDPGIGPGLPDDPPPAEPKAKEKADKPKAKADEEEADDKDKGKEKREWDRDRQKRDQELATLRKERDANKAELESLKKMVADLSKAKPAKDDEPDPIDGLSEDSPTADFAAAIKQVKKMAATTAKQVAEKEAVIESLTAKLADREKKDAEQAEEVEVQTYLQATYKELADEYGREFQTAAIAAAKEELAKDGYDDEDNPPTAGAMKAAVKYHWRTLSAEAKAEKPGKPRPNAPTLDGGTGGRAATANRTGKLSDVIAEMKKTGEWDR